MARWVWEPIRGSGVLCSGKTRVGNVNYKISVSEEKDRPKSPVVSI